MFNKIELTLLHQSVNKTLEQINQQRHGEDVSEELRQELDQQVVHYITLNNKLIAQVPNNTFDGIALSRFTPILVIDDSLIDRDINSTLLKELGFSKVLEAKEGQEALALMSEYHKNGMPIGLVMCDWNMPNMSGIEFIKLVRRDKVLWNTPIFLVTANHDKAHIITAVKAGTSGYIVKPVSFKGLQNKFAPYLPVEKAES